MVVSVTVQGAAGLRRDLDRFADDLDGDLDGAWDDVAQRGAQLVSSFAPRRTGRLASSFTGRGGRGEGEVTSPLIYAGVIDGGWRRRNITPARYTDRAATAWERAAAARIDSGVGDAIRQRGLQ